MRPFLKQPYLQDFSAASGHNTHYRAQYGGGRRLRRRALAQRSLGAIPWAWIPAPVLASSVAVALLDSSSSKSAETFPCTSITRRAVSTSDRAMSRSRRSFTTSTASALGGRGPRCRGSSAPSAPASRCTRHFPRCELYRPSRRNRAPTSPGFKHASASRTIDSLYFAEYRRRRAASASSGSGTPPARRARRTRNPARLRLPAFLDRRHPSPPAAAPSPAPSLRETATRQHFRSHPQAQ